MTQHHAPSAEPGWYRIGVPIEARSYELTGLAASGPAPFAFETVRADLWRFWRRPRSLEKYP